MKIMFDAMIIDESINAMDDGCDGTGENVERTKAEIKTWSRSINLC